ncbi:MAG: DUF484 family protein [Zoogloeaceae bacterium]|nr:DUF484 family protein [Zoogloeaceae bacterium]
MTAESVAQYLRANPQFFEQYAEMFAEITLPHPHGGRTISLSERQMVSLREKNRHLERQLAEFLNFGEANDAIGEKMHRFSVALVAAETPQAALQLVNLHLKEDFAVPALTLKLWEALPGLPELPGFVAITPEHRAFVETLGKPYCGTATPESAAAWFGAEAPRIRSEALVPLGNGGGSIGLIALGSEDARRFYADMGTLYLARLGELVSTALLRTTHSAL